MTEQSDTPTFIGLPRATLDALDGVSVAVFGAAEASPYDPACPSHSADAPAALRRASMQFARSLRQYDFDLDATYFRAPDDWRGMVDCGDVPTATTTPEENRAAITAATRRILAAGAVPILLGGDDSVPIPFIAGWADRGPVTILHIDAHVDWADTVQGNPMGYGSPMRRAAEMDHVTAMVQLGIRGLGSGERWQHDDARAWGSQIFTAYRLHEPGGIDRALDALPAGQPIVVSIDCDGMDPAVLPAVNMPTPGGPGYEDLVRILRGAAARAPIAGLALTEYVPARDDANAMSGLVAARLATVAMGLAAGIGGADPGA